METGALVIWTRVTVSIFYDDNNYTATTIIYSVNGDMGKDYWLSF